MCIEFAKKLKSVSVMAIFLITLTLQALLFWKKQGFSPKKARVFLFAEPLKSLEKEGKTHKKSKENRKMKKARKSKKSKDWRVRVITKKECR